jgi:hypothetical protein
MNYDTIVAIETFIDRLDNPRKQIIARELVVNPNYQIVEMTIFNNTDLFVKEIKSGNTYKLSTFISSKCNC